MPLWCHSSLESSLYYAATYLKLSFLDPSVKHWDDTSGHCRHKGTSVSYLNDTICCAIYLQK
ncbi:hypothetical protein [Wolbachia endosymbiont (group A) of Agelastica alni]|uniref:hypothetical protein n=1 Tax=Wolbachia endosymbiont (group A) of Agelastica alni TaxID=3066130 RepID=UPI003132B741